MPDELHEPDQPDMDELQTVKLSELTLAGWLLLLLTIPLMIATAFAFCEWVLPLLPEGWAMGGKDLWSLPVLLIGVLFFCMGRIVLEEALGLRIIKRRHFSKEALAFYDEQSWVDRIFHALMIFALAIPGATFFTVIAFRAAILEDGLRGLERFAALAVGVGCLTITLFLLLVGCRTVVGPRASAWLDVAINRLKWATVAVMMIGAAGAVWQILHASSP